MSWIAQVEEHDATGELAEAFAQLRAQRGKVANILKVHSLRPGALGDHLQLYMGLMFGAGRLSRRERELIAVAASQANQCAYCAAHHLEALARYERDEELFAAIARDAGEAPLSSRDRALVVYARKLTKAPQHMVEQDVESLREQGFEDDAILLVNLITSYFNFVNRIALGLGVAFTAEEISGYQV